MADAPNTVSSLNGLFKEVYGDDIKQLVPDGAKVQKYIPFAPKQKELGNQYHQPVLLAYENGFTFAAADSGAFSLNDAVNSVMKDATVNSSQIVLKAQMSYEAAAKAAKGRNAFQDATDLMFESMQKSMRKRIEVECMYGVRGLATVASVSSLTITITTAEFAPGIWSGMEGASINVYDTTLATNRGSAVITSVDLDARTITVDAVPSGTVATDVIFYAGAKGNEMTGIHSILTNTGSLFGISAATYTLWKSSSQAAGGALSQAIIGKAISKAVAKGLDDDCLLLVNPKTWTDLLSDQAALVRHTGSAIGSKVQNGSQSIEFYSQNGNVRIEPSIYVKEGYAYGLSLPAWMRLGASDVTMKTPGYGDDIFQQLQTKAGYEVRSYTSQAVFSHAPGKNFIITGIVNS